MRKVLVSSLLMMVVLILVACGPKYEGLDKDAAGEITIMLWSGDGEFYEDIGKKNLTPEDLISQNAATVYAVAKEFNKDYPNVKINVITKVNGPNDDGVSWSQFRENFVLEHGKNVDIWASTDLPGEVQRGMVADLSVFSDDPLYKSFNPGIMNMMNYYGVQAGLPQFLQPWGVFINKELADNNNIDIPEPDWTIEDYTDFVSHSVANSWYGSMDTPKSFIFTGTTTMAHSLINHSGNDPYLNMNSEEVRSLIPYIAEWAEHSVWPQWDKIGDPMAPFMDANGWWSYNFFKNGALLTLDGDPWMLGDAANPDPNHWGAVQSDNWDIYPRPSTDFVDNTVGVVLDPLAIHNYALDDKDPELSDEEFAKLQIAYTFASFWIGDDRAWQARADQLFTDGETQKTSMNDSVPLVTGDAFERQMEIWYSATNHQMLSDKERFPGFHYMMEVFASGNVQDVSDKAYPWYYDNEGARSEILYEWNNFNLPNVLTGDPEATSPRRTDAGFTNAVLAKLPEWNTVTNQRLADEWAKLIAGLKTHYGKTDEDFK